MGVKTEKSFSLIEMVIVVGVIGLVLPILFAIVFLIMQQQVRIYSLQEVKKQGDEALFSIKNTVRQYGKTVSNPTLYPYPTIVDICPVYPTPMLTPMPFLHVYDEDGVGFTYGLTPGDNIASNSAQNNITDLLLTGNTVTISNLEFNCFRTNQFSPPIISVNYRVTKAGTEPNPPYMNYGTKFQLKSY